MTAGTRASHTPGPWSYHYSRSAPDDEWIIGAEGFAPVIAFVVRDEDSKLTGAQVEANARLITAAPELLEAVKDVAPRFAKGHRVRITLELLIAKAEGRGL